MQASVALEKIANAGVVGAGGAGFPTHVKIKTKAEVVIANCAECEPLLKVDRQLMENFAAQIIKGIKIVMQVSKAPRGVIAVKSHNHKAVETMKAEAAKHKNIEVFQLGNYYPAGDEQQIVYEVVGKAVPVGGIPINVGAVVCNTNTLINVANAVEDIPVTDKYVTVNGAVRNPVTLNAPIGTPVSMLIELAGGPGPDQGYSLIIGGPAMGRVTNDWNTPVTKTTGGVIVLPTDHPLIQKKSSAMDTELRLARTVCCQCSTCTTMCPRNKLGLGVEPHKVMRAIAYGNADSLGKGDNVFGCCDCGLCTYYACPMGLSPSRFITMVKGGLAKQGIKPTPKEPDEVDESREASKVPTERLIQRMGISEYNVDAPMRFEPVSCSKVKILLKQHIGAPATAVVGEGDMVEKGALIGAAPTNALGAAIHASISGKVVKVTPEFIEIDAKA